MTQADDRTGGPLPYETAGDADPVTAWPTPAIPAPAIPDPSRPPYSTWYGAVGIALAAVASWVVVVQLLPGIVAAVMIANNGGHAALTGDAAAAAFTPYLPMIVIMGMFMSLLVVLVFRSLGWLAPDPASTDPLRRRIGWVALATVACIGGSIIISWLMYSAGAEATEQEVLVEASATGGILFVLAVALFGPIGEELIFRRVLFSALDKGAGRILAYLLPALIFALVHLNPPAFPLYVWMGFCFAFAYVKSGSVLGGMAVHVVNNSWAVLLMQA